MPCHIVRVLVHILSDVGGVDSGIGLQQPFCGHYIVGIGGAAKPDIGGGVAVLLLNLGLDLTGGQALESGLDTVELLELLAGGGQILLLAGAVDY